MVEPTTYKQAMASLDSKSWQAAILVEYPSIQEAGKWTVHDMSDLPAGRRPVGSKWVFKVKNNGDQSVERYKARIVAKGYSHIEGLDYDETFAPVTRYDSLRFIIALATHLALDTTRLVIKSAFLHVYLVQEIRMVPAPDISLDGKILGLDKAFDGRKQAPLAWFENLSEDCTEIGFIPLPFDPCVFISADPKIIVVAYLVDITTAGSDLISINSLIIFVLGS